MILINKFGNEEYWLSDIESGQWYQCSKEYYEDRQAFIKSLTPKDYKGQVLVFGTAGEIPDKGWEEMFYNPNTFKILDNTWEDKLDRFFIPAYANTTRPGTKEESDTRESNSGTDI